MKSLFWGWWLSVWAAACCLSAAFWTAIHPGAAALPLLVATGWWYARRKKWRWATGAALPLIFFEILIATLVDAPAGLLVPAALLGTASWDLAHFQRLIEGNQADIEAEGLIKHHFLFLGFSLILGGGMTVFALRLTLNYRFLWLLGLGVLLILAMRQLVSSLPGRE